MFSECSRPALPFRTSTGRFLLSQRRGRGPARDAEGQHLRFLEPLNDRAKSALNCSVPDVPPLRKNASTGGQGKQVF